MHLTVPSHWSRSIVTGGRDESERVVTIVVARTLPLNRGRANNLIDVEDGSWTSSSIV